MKIYGEYKFAQIDVTSDGNLTFTVGANHLFNSSETPALSFR